MKVLLLLFLSNICQFSQDLSSDVKRRIFKESKVAHQNLKRLSIINVYMQDTTKFVKK